MTGKWVSRVSASAALAMATLLLSGQPRAADGKRYLGTMCTPSEQSESGDFMSTSGRALARTDQDGGDVYCPIIMDIEGNVLLDPVNVEVYLATNRTMSCDLILATHFSTLVDSISADVTANGYATISFDTFDPSSIPHYWTSNQWLSYTLKCDLEPGDSIRNYYIVED